jgi:hypothetical protein
VDFLVHDADGMERQAITGAESYFGESGKSMKAMGQ